jgi:zona occludens toxin (predicted ATPase)
VQAVTAPASPPPEGARKSEPGQGRKAWAIVYLFALAVVLSVAGLFWINHEVHVVAGAEERSAQQQQQSQQAAARRQQAQQAAAAVKQSKAICVALVGLDDARIGAEFAPPSRTGVPLSKSYGARLAHAIHAVVNATRCRALLAGKLPS